VAVMAEFKPHQSENKNNRDRVTGLSSSEFEINFGRFRAVALFSVSQEGEPIV